MKGRKKLPAGAVPIFGGSTSSGSGLFDEGGDGAEEEGGKKEAVTSSGLFGDDEDDWMTGSVRSTKGRKSNGEHHTEEFVLCDV